jgi:hypothetical protein
MSVFYCDFAHFKIQVPQKRNYIIIMIKSICGKLVGWIMRKDKKIIKRFKKKLSCPKHKIELSKNNFNLWATCLNVFFSLKGIQ